MILKLHVGLDCKLSEWEGIDIERGRTPHFLKRGVTTLLCFTSTARTSARRLSKFKLRFPRYVRHASSHSSISLHQSKYPL